MKTNLDLNKLSKVAARLGLKVEAGRAAPMFSVLPSRFNLIIDGQHVFFHKEPGSPVEWVSDKLKLGRVLSTRFQLVLIPAVKLNEMHDAGRQDDYAPLDRGVVCVRIIDEKGEELEGVREFLAHSFKGSEDTKTFLDAANVAMSKSYHDMYTRHFKKVDDWKES
jgi:hypothetical protein